MQHGCVIISYVLYFCSMLTAVQWRPIWSKSIALSVFCPQWRWAAIGGREMELGYRLYCSASGGAAGGDGDGGGGQSGGEGYPDGEGDGGGKGDGVETSEKVRLS